MVSGTSWTPDEDFGLLLEALQIYDKEAGSTDSHKEKNGSRANAITSSNNSTRSSSSAGSGESSIPSAPRLPRLLVVVTGKGPQKAMYEERIRNMTWSRVRVKTAWLASADYPRLLGAADLGVSLHTSSSGLDLPMKVVDMFGAGLPVLAARFACVEELVRGGENGGLFEDAEGLSRHLMRLLLGWGGSGGGTKDQGGVELGQLRRTVLDARSLDSWDENWNRYAGPEVLHGRWKVDKEEEEEEEDMQGERGGGGGNRGV